MEENSETDVITEESDSGDGQLRQLDDACHEEGDLGEREIPYAEEHKEIFKILPRYYLRNVKNKPH